MGLARRTVWAFLWLSCCCASDQTLRIEPGGPEHGRGLEFEVLAAYSISAERLRSLLAEHEAPGGSLRASDQGSFSDAWRNFRLPGEAPPLDFSSREVLFVATREWAICGVLAPTALESTPDALVLRVPTSASYTCPRLRWKLDLYADIEPTRSFVLRVVAVPRQAAPVRVLRFGPADAFSAARGPRAEPTNALGATVAIPPVGEVTLAELEDGSRVWVARHQNGEITVLAGDLPVPTAAVGGPREVKPPPPGIFVPSLWQPAARCYNSLFDEFGRPTFRSLPPLDRYEFARDPVDSERLQIGQRRSGERGLLAERPCIPMDDQVYSAYPPRKIEPQLRFLTVGGQHDARHTVALGVEFPLQYPKLSVEKQRRD